MKTLAPVLALGAILATSFALMAKTTGQQTFPYPGTDDSSVLFPVPISIDDLAVPVNDRSEFQRSAIPRHVQRLRGKRVRLIGQMYLPVVSRDVDQFTFSGDTRKQTRLGLDKSRLPLQHLIKVSLRNGKTAKSTFDVIQVEGRLSIELEYSGGELQFLYKIQDATIRPAKREEGYQPSLLNLPSYPC